MSSISLADLQNLKNDSTRFACLTAYDASFARLISTAGVEVILIGDSLGMTIQGRASTLPVKVSDMAYHTACVARGNRGSLLLADMPFGSYGDPYKAVRSAARLMRAGAAAVKLEGGEWLAETITRLRDCGIPSCAHLGLQPQSINLYGKYHKQATKLDDAVSIGRQALKLEQAGASLMLIEHVPELLGGCLQKALKIPVIGIGAGPYTDGQVLVMQDALGITEPEKLPPFAKNFLEDAQSLPEAVTKYRDAVLAGKFPLRSPDIRTPWSYDSDTLEKRVLEAKTD